MRSESVRIGGKRISFYRREGEGDPLLFFHATGFHARIWDQIASQFSGRLVYQVDMPGHGNSDSPGERFYWDDAGADLADLVEALQLEKVLGVGHSMGGHLMLSAAARQSQRFRQLLLLDPVILPLSTTRAMQKMNTDVIARRRNDWQSPQAFYEAYCKRPPFKYWDPEVFRDYADHALTPRDGGSGYRLACAPDFEASVYRNFGAEAIHEQLPGIQVPTHIVRAKEPDAGDKPLDFQRSPTWPDLVNRLPAASEDYRPDLGHFFPMEKPQFVTEKIGLFLP